MVMMMIHLGMYISMLRDDYDDDDHDGDDDDPPGNVHLHVESQQPVADLLLGPHLHRVVRPVDDQLIMKKLKRKMMMMMIMMTSPLGCLSCG